MRPPPATGRPAPTKLRPFVITRGRTCASRALGVETLLRTVRFDPGTAAALQPEERGMYSLCQRPCSVVELAHLLRLPMGVVRVVADDLTRKGLVEILPDASDGAGLDLLRRVKRGLENLPC